MSNALLLPKEVDAATQNGSAAPRETVDRVLAIEGMRAWLAWAVVVAHVAQMTGFVYTHRGWHVLSLIANEAVHMFIIISGFVITGLLLTRREPWLAYITRRAFRLFPAYFIALAFAAVAIFLGAQAFEYMSWRDHPSFRFDDAFQSTVASVAAAPWPHALLDLTLMQGVVPDEVLPRARTAVLGPAWSLSLEWQFYLIAPALLWLLLNPRTRLLTLIAAIGLIGLFRVGGFGSFSLPSFLPGAIHLFLIGIGSRLGFDALRDRIPAPAALTLGLMGLAVIFHNAAAVFLWCALLIFVATPQWRDFPLARRAASALTESKTARELGARSYSVYILHYPIMLTMAYLILPLGSFSQFEALALLGVSTVALTFVASDLMYRYVERPMIRVGARIASARAKRTGAALNQTVQARTP